MNAAYSPSTRAYATSSVHDTLPWDTTPTTFPAESKAGPPESPKHGRPGAASTWNEEAETDTTVDVDSDLADEGSPNPTIRTTLSSRTASPRAVASTLTGETAATGCASSSSATSWAGVTGSYDGSRCESVTAIDEPGSLAGFGPKYTESGGP